MIHKPQKNKFIRFAKLMYYAMKGRRTRKIVSGSSKDCKHSPILT